MKINAMAHVYALQTLAGGMEFTQAHIKTFQTLKVNSIAE